MTAVGNGARALNEKIDQLIREGNVRRIVVRNDDGRTVLDLPIVVGLAAVLLAPTIAVAGAAIGLVGGWSIDVERVGDEPGEESSSEPGDGPGGESSGEPGEEPGEEPGGETSPSTEDTRAEGAPGDSEDSGDSEVSKEQS